MVGASMPWHAMAAMLFGGAHSAGSLSYAECAYLARGLVPPSALLDALASAGVTMHTCLGLARRGGWEPLISTERGEKRDDDALLRLWTRLLSSGIPFNASGLPFEHPPGAPADPLDHVARLFALAAQTVAAQPPSARAARCPAPQPRLCIVGNRCPAPQPRLCIVGNSVSRNLAMDLRLGRSALLGSCPSCPLAEVRYYNTNFGIDAWHNGRHCLRCTLRSALLRMPMAAFAAALTGGRAALALAPATLARAPERRQDVPRAQGARLPVGN